MFRRKHLAVMDQTVLLPSPVDQLAYFFVLEKLRMLNPRKCFSMLRTAAKYFASSGLRALLDLFI